MPVKNGMPFIKQTIQSVLSQDFADFELVISDDRSSDGTSDFLEGVTDPRVKLTCPPSPLKVDAHWTFVSNLSSSPYTKLLCADDVLTPGSLKRQMAALVGDPEIDVVISSRRIIDQHGLVIIEKHGRAGLTGELSGIDALRKSFLSGTNIFGEPSGLIIKTSTLKRNLPWVSKFPYMLDFELYTRLFIDSKVKFIESVDSEFRVHGNSISARESGDHFQQFISIYRQFQIRNPDLVLLNSREERQMKALTAAKTYLRSIIFKYANVITKFKKLSNFHKTEL